MTNVPEAFLAKEAGIAYSTVAMVTDFDCWKDEDHCTVDEILRVMKDNNLTAKKLIKKVIVEFHRTAPAYQKENQYAVITSQEKISKLNQDIIKVLLQ
jgi:5'-methylthioadenosine phosphorylase